MSFVLLSISGHDRPGIVRDVAESMLHLKANIEDSSMTALRGRFAMMLIVRLPEDTTMMDLKAALAELEQRTGLTVQSQVISAEEVAVETAEPDYVVTVHGADQVGIVYGVSHALAELGVSIVDVSTRVRQSGSDSLYLMALEVFAGAHGDEMRIALAKLAGKLGVDIECHEMDEALL